MANLWQELLDMVADVALPYTAEDVANKDTDDTLAANSDEKYPSQKAVRTFVEARVLMGSGEPEGVVTATPGVFYIDVDGDDGRTIWAKKTGSGNTGWGR